MNTIVRRRLFLCTSCDLTLLLSVNSYKLTCIISESRCSASSSSNDDGNNKNNNNSNNSHLPKKKRDHYEVLGVEKRAQAKDIKDAYIKLSKAYHPDVNKSANAMQMFQEVATAYETIGSYDGRRNYDRKMFGAQLQTQIRRAADSTSPAPFQAGGFRRPGHGTGGQTGKTEDYTQGLYTDKLGRERIYKRSPFAEEFVSKKPLEEEIYFDPKDSLSQQSTNYMKPSLQLERKALDMRRTVIKKIAETDTEHLNDASNNELLVPLLIVMVILFVLYAVSELNHLKKLINEGDTLGDKLIEKRKLDPNYLDREEVKVKFINTTAYHEMKKSEKG